MSREKPYRYVVTFYVEADSQKALEAAVNYVVEHVKDRVEIYACSRNVCVCKVKLEWDGNSKLTVKSCMKRTANIIARWLVNAYVWHGGGSIRLVKCEEYKP
jgi:hypothetical protein